MQSPEKQVTFKTGLESKNTNHIMTWQGMSRINTARADEGEWTQVREWAGKVRGEGAWWTGRKVEMWLEGGRYADRDNIKWSVCTTLGL